MGGGLGLQGLRDAGMGGGIRDVKIGAGVE